MKRAAFTFRTFGELEDALSRMTEEEKSMPVSLAIDDVNLKTLGHLDFATEDWPNFESGDSLAVDQPYLW